MSLTREEIEAIKWRVSELVMTPGWLIEKAWREYSDTMWAAGCILPDDDKIDGFKEWFREKTLRDA